SWRDTSWRSAPRGAAPRGLSRSRARALEATSRSASDPRLLLSSRAPPSQSPLRAQGDALSRGRNLEGLDSHLGRLWELGPLRRHRQLQRVSLPWPPFATRCARSCEKALRA